MEKYEQQLKYLAHICRMENDQLQKQLLFNTNLSKWTKFENLLGLDAQQLRRTMMPNQTWAAENDDDEYARVNERIVKKM